MGIFFKWKVFFGLAVLLLFTSNVFAQKEPLFVKIPLDSIGIRCYEMLCRRSGTVIFTSSAGLWTIIGNEARMTTAMDFHGIKNLRSYMSEDGIRAITESPDSLFFYATHDNIISSSHDAQYPSVVHPIFYFPPKGQSVDNVSSMYCDNDGDLYIGTSIDNFYLVKNGGTRKNLSKVEIKLVDSMITISKGELPVTKIILAPKTGVFSFTQDNIDKSIIWIGTNYGLYSFNKITGQSKIVLPKNVTIGSSLTITHMEMYEHSVYFSTLEKGMGYYDKPSNTMYFNPYPKIKSNATTNYPIKTFCYKSPDDFFVAIMDSLPAVYNIKSGSYAFIDDSSLHRSANTTTDIKVDKLGNLLVIKGGAIYICKASANKFLASAIKIDSTLLAPFISAVYYFPNGELIPPNNHGSFMYYDEIRSTYDKSSFIIKYAIADFVNKDSMEFAWKIDGYTSGWVNQIIRNNDSAQFAMILGLKPGKYILEVKVKVGSEDWRKQQAKMIIIISPPFWKTWWFWTLVIGGTGSLIGLLFWWRIKVVKKRERERFAHEKQLLEFEAMALRAQMNPHFIFNCLNSIKSLMQEQQTEKGITYLTTFSKLIRTLFNNADKKEVSLYDEIETCKLYLQLEAMRFDTKFSFAVNVDENIDLKSIQVPALIIQPFIENAIWHGIVPRNNGGKISLNVLRKDGVVEVVIDDDGIGREASAQNKSTSGLAHQSKGVNLTQSRLELNNLLQQRQAKLETIDKQDETGASTGTKVIITIKEEV